DQRGDGRLLLAQDRQPVAADPAASAGVFAIRAVRKIQTVAAAREASDETLRTEYAQITKTRIEYIKTLLQIVVLYLAITGVTFDYAIGESSLTPKFYIASIFDIVIGGFGATVMFIADNHISKLSLRL